VGCLAKALEPNKTRNSDPIHRHLPDVISGDEDRVYLRPSHIPDVSAPIVLFSLTMSPTLPGFLFDIPRNPVVAVGLPLTLGFLSGSGTKKVINGIWYQVLQCLCVT